MMSLNLSFNLAEDIRVVHEKPHKSLKFLIGNCMNVVFDVISFVHKNWRQILVAVYAFDILKKTKKLLHVSSRYLPTVPSGLAFLTTTLIKGKEQRR